MAIVGVAQVKVTPDLKTFRTDLERGLKEMNPEISVKVKPDFDKADKDIEAWRAKQSNKKAIKQKIDIDTSAFDKIGGAGSAIAGVTSKIQLATIAGSALIASMQALGPILAGLAGGVAFLPAALIGAIGPIAAIKLGADGIKKAFEGLKPTLDTLKSQISSSFQSSLAPAVNQLKSVLPGLKVGFQSIATALGGVVTQVASMLNQGQKTQQLNTIFIVMSQVIQNLGKAVAPIISALINIAEIAIPLFAQATKGAGSAAQKFNEWTASAEGGQKISDMLTGAISAFKTLMQILTQVGGIFAAVFQGISAGAGNLGGSVIPVLTQINAVLSSTAGQQALQALGAAVSALGTAFASQLGAALTAVLPYLTQFLNWVAQNASTLAPLIAGVGAAALVFGKLAPVISGVSSAIGVLGPLVKTLGPAFGSLFNILKANPILVLVGAIVALLASTGNLQPIINALMGAFKVLLPVIQQLASVVGGALMTVFNALMPPLQQLISALIPPLMTVIQALMPVITQLAQFIGQLVTALAPIIQLIGQLVASLLPPLISLFTSVLTPVLNLAAAFLGPIVSAIGSVIGWITNLWGQINQAGGILAVLKNVFSVAWNFIKGVWSAVSGFFVGIWNGIVNTAKSVISGIGNVFSSVWDFIKSIWSGVGRFFSGIWDGIVGGLKSVLNGAIKVINGIISGINLLPGVNIPKIPMLARGGTAEDGRPYIVGEKGPELFVPGRTGRVVDNANTVKALNASATSTGASNDLDSAIERGLSRAQFNIDPSGQARITVRGASYNSRR